MKSLLLGSIAFVLHNSCRYPGQILLILIFEMRSLSLREVKSGHCWAARKRQGMTRTPVLRLLVPCTFPPAECVSGFPCAWHLSPLLVSSSLHPHPMNRQQATKAPDSQLCLKPGATDQPSSPKSPEVNATHNTGGRAEDTGLKLLPMAKSPFKEIINDGRSGI